MYNRLTHKSSLRLLGLDGEVHKFDVVVVRIRFLEQVYACSYDDFVNLIGAD